MKRQSIKKIHRTCRMCRKKFATYSTSNRKYCHRCHMKIARENIQQLMRKEGKYYERWLSGMDAFLSRLRKK